MKFPSEMVSRDRWLLWKLVGGKGKVPYTATGYPASVTNPRDWCSYEDAVRAKENGGFSGLGYVLGDGICGIDLDNAIDADGNIKSWAAEYIDKVYTAWEISQSGKGIHLFYAGDVPTAYKRKIEDGGVEVYAAGRFFAVTGIEGDTTLAEIPQEFLIAPGQDEPVEQASDVPDPTADDVARCRERVMAGHDSVSGEFGHNTIFAACCELARWNLTYEQSWEIINEYNENKCFPPWTRLELKRKIKEGRRQVVKEGKIGIRLTNTGLDDFDELTIDGDIVATDEVPRIIPFNELRQHAGSLKWLVEDIFVQGQFAGIVGAFKTMKSSISLDMAVSLASGTPFLGRFAIPEKKRVLMYSGEIGLPTALIKLDAICQSKNIELDELEGAWLCPVVPLVKSVNQRKQLNDDLNAHRADVVIIDPWFAAASGADASQLIQISDLIGQALAVCNKNNVQLIINHHCHRNLPEGEPLGLSAISGAGVAENLRQWMILSHASPYQLGVANLWLSCGGSAGQCGMYRATIDEGIVDGEIMNNRRWDVVVSDSEDALDTNERLIIDIVGNGRSDVASIAKITGITKKIICSCVKSLVGKGILQYNGDGVELCSKDEMTEEEQLRQILS